MAAWIPPSLRPLLGNDFEAIDCDLLMRLIGIEEGDNLDFKSEMYAKTDSDRRELCRDVAQFANAGGGLLVVGMGEEQARAVALTPLSKDESRPDYALWYDQTISRGVSPSLETTRRVLRLDDSDEVLFLVSVPPSPQQPHAVLINDGLQYCVRTGSTRRYLSEMELADRYRQRGLRISDVRQRAEQLGQDVLSLIPRAAEPSQDRIPLWLTLSAIPDVDGSADMRRGLADEWTEWFWARFRETPNHPSAVLSNDPRFAPRFRSMELRRRGDDGQLPSVRCRLNLDGSGLFAQAAYVTSIDATDTWVGEDDPQKAVSVTSWLTVQQLISSIWVLSAHAARCGALGNLTLQAQIVSGSSAHELLAMRSRDETFRDRMPGTIAVKSPTPLAVRTFPIDGLAMSPRSVLEAARHLAQDAFSHFGLAEAPQFNDEGKIISENFGGRSHPDASTEIEQWLKQEL